ncbi:MAG: cohesin domain-containing protein [Nanoarchaeota archaeon]
MIRKLFVMLVFFVVFLGIASALNEIYVSPASLNINQGQSFSIDINGIALANTSDVFGVQFDLIYNQNVISILSVSKEGFLGNGSTTFFDYKPFSGGITIYNVRNTTTGIYGSGTFATIDFNAVGSGNSTINLSNVIWVNSIITNDSAETISVGITNGSVSINSTFFCGNGIVEGIEQCDGINLSSQTCTTISGGFTGGSLSCMGSCVFDTFACTTGSSSSGSSGGGGGGGGGSSGTPSVVNNTNQTSVGSGNTNLPQGDNAQAPANGDEGVAGISDTSGDEVNKGFLALTGNIIGRGAIAVVQSWAFYFILFVSIIFVTVLLIRRQRKKRGLHRLLNHRHFGY